MKKYMLYVLCIAFSMQSAIASNSAKFNKFCKDNSQALILGGTAAAVCGIWGLVRLQQKKKAKKAKEPNIKAINYGERKREAEAAKFSSVSAISSTPIVKRSVTRSQDVAVSQRALAGAAVVRTDDYIASPDRPVIPIFECPKCSAAKLHDAPVSPRIVAPVIFPPVIVSKRDTQTQTDDLPREVSDRKMRAEDRSIPARIVLPSPGEPFVKKFIVFVSHGGELQKNPDMDLPLDWLTGLSVDPRTRLAVDPQTDLKNHPRSIRDRNTDVDLDEHYYGFEPAYDNPVRYRFASNLRPAFMAPDSMKCTVTDDGSRIYHPYPENTSIFFEWKRKKAATGVGGWSCSPGWYYRLRKDCGRIVLFHPTNDSEV